MRRITERRLDEGGFEGAVQEMVRMAPWWLISGVVHTVVLLILWQMQMTQDTKETTSRMEAAMPEEVKEPEVPPVEEPQPVVPNEEITETPIETDSEVSDHNEVDTDSEFHETAGTDGLSDAPFTGPS